MFRRLLRKVPFLITFVGAGFVAFGVYLPQSAKSFIANSAEAQVTVLSVESKVDDGQTMYRPVFGVTDENGHDIRYASNWWVRPKPHNAGEVVLGRINWETGEIRSEKMMQNDIAFSSKLFPAGLAILLVGLVLIYRRKLRTFFSRRT